MDMAPTFTSSSSFCISIGSSSLFAIISLCMTGCKCFLFSPGFRGTAPVNKPGRCGRQNLRYPKSMPHAHSSQKAAQYEGRRDNDSRIPQKGNQKRRRSEEHTPEL